MYWSQDCEDTFNKLKAQLASSDTLVHYDPELPLILTTDARDIGIGAFIAHRFPDGRELPIAYASQLLTDCERMYSVIEHEALGIIFGIGKFAQFLLGRKFVIKTNHKPLEALFSQRAQLPKLAAN